MENSLKYRYKYLFQRIWIDYMRSVCWSETLVPVFATFIRKSNKTQRHRDQLPCRISSHLSLEQSAPTGREAMQRCLATFQQRRSNMLALLCYSRACLVRSTASNSITVPTNQYRPVYTYYEYLKVYWTAVSLALSFDFTTL